MGRLDEHLEVLKRNTEVVESTFEKFNLKLLDYAYLPSDGWSCCWYIIELSTIEGTLMKEDAHIKINFYDKDGRLIYSEDEVLSKDDVDGYNTFKLSFQSMTDKRLHRCQTAKIFLSKV